MPERDGARFPGSGGSVAGDRSVASNALQSPMLPPNASHGVHFPVLPPVGRPRPRGAGSLPAAKQRRTPNFAHASFPSPGSERPPRHPSCCPETLLLFPSFLSHQRRLRTCLPNWCFSSRFEGTPTTASPSFEAFHSSFTRSHPPFFAPTTAAPQPRPNILFSETSCYALNLD